MRYALSRDGKSFEALSNKSSFFSPKIGEERLFRDPFIFLSSQRYHLLWTNSWNGVSIGHSTSEDLIHWDEPRAIPVMASVAGTRNCWAPKAVYDDISDHWLIFWSSTVSGMFSETEGSSENGYNHRIWFTTTKDFLHFEPPEVLFDPGFNVIDGTFVVKGPSEHYIIFKEETASPAKKWLRVAHADKLSGPFDPPSRPFTRSWVEGPMTAMFEDLVICYFDIYREGCWGAAVTRDMRDWKDISQHIVMPRGARHGSICRIPEKAARILEQS